MDKNEKRTSAENQASSPALFIIIIISIIFVSALTWTQYITQFFTAKDTLSLIDSGRINTIGDFGRIFSEPLMNGTEFVENVRYYRPISQLSFSIDYFLWGLNPFGYHLTNILLHTFVSILVFFSAYCLLQGRIGIAWFSSILFTLHPSLVESVPAMARRQDIMASAFIISAFIFATRYANLQPKRKWHLALSITCYVLALGSKELSIVFPFLILSYSFVYSEAKSRKITLWRSLKLVLPFIGVTLIWFVWRALILGGIGGPVGRTPTLTNIITKSGVILKNYLEGLFLPVNHLSSFMVSPQGILLKIVTLILVVVFLTLLFLTRQDKVKDPQTRRNKRENVMNKILLGAASLAAIGILMFPYVSHYISKIIQKVYTSQKPQILYEILAVKAASTIESQIYGVRVLYITLCILVVIFSCLLLFGLRTFRKTEKIELKRASIFLSIWLALPLCLYLSVQNYTHWNIYFSLIPFSMVIGSLIDENFSSIKSGIKRGTRLSNVSFRSLLVSSILLVSLLLSIYAYSPLHVKYNDWEQSGILISSFLNDLLSIVKENPEAEIVHIHNLPQGISSVERKIPFVKSVTYFSSYNIKSWIDLHLGRTDLEIFLHDTSRITDYPEKILLKTKKMENKEIFIDILVEY